MQISKYNLQKNESLIGDKNSVLPSVVNGCKTMQMTVAHKQISIINKSFTIKRRMLGARQPIR